MGKWFEQKKHPPVENEPCKNCGTVFSGHYCPECGQSEQEINRPFSIVFYDFLGNIFAFDTRFWKTFIKLLSSPGFLTKEFFAGRRVRYAPPLRLFIFVSFILFLLLQIYSNRQLNALMYDSGYSQFYLDDSSKVVVDSVLNDIGGDLNEEGIAIAAITDTVGTTNLGFDASAFADVKNLKEALDVIAVQLEAELEKESDPEKQAKLVERINLTRSPQMAITRMLKYMSWAFFLLLPIFALILKLFYIRRNQYYIRHLIFSIHLHSFIFIVFTLLVVLFFFLNAVPGVVILVLLLTIPIYFIIALKKFYGQNIVKVLFKFTGISMLYYSIFGTIVIFVFLNALSII